MKVGDKVQFKYTGNKKYDNKFGIICQVMNDDIVMVNVAGVKTTAYVSQLDVKTKEDLDEWRENKINGKYRRNGFPSSRSKPDDSDE